MNAPVLVTFDVDGTLIDSQSAIMAAMEDAFGACDLAPPTREEVLSIVGLSLPQAMAAMRPALSQTRIHQLVEAYRAGFVHRREAGQGEASVPLYPGAKSCLETLSALPHVILGAATGKARRGLDVVISAHGLEGLFTTLQTADLHPSKPHPSMLHSACDETGIAPGRAVMIGDTSFDMEMGRAAGFHTIGVRWGYHDDARLGAEADILVPDFDALAAHLMSWMEKLA